MYGIAVDIGATYTRVALGNDAGKLLEVVKFKTRELKTPGEMAEKIAQVSRHLIAKYGVDAVGVGIGSAGPLDIEEGAIVNSPNMPFKRIPLVKPLRDSLGLPVALANDCNAAVVGERVWGAGKGYENVVYVTISTGIGGGAYVNGSLLLGKDGNAVEVGHIVVDSQERLVCGCGGRGHWEAYSSGSGIPRYALLLAEENPDLWSTSLLSGMGEITAKDVFEAYRRGDVFARKVIEDVLRYNDYGFSAIINLFDPEVLTIGGSVALNNSDIIIRPLGERLEKYLINRMPRIMPTPLGENVVLLGALAIALGKEEKILPQDAV